MSDHSFLKRSCPGCSAATFANSKSVFSQPRAETLTFTDVSEYWRGFRSKNVFFTFKRCDNCSLLYCPSYLSDLQLSGLYSEMDDNTAGEHIDTLKRTQARYVTDMSDSIDLQGHWLELGADIGLLTEQLLEQTEIRNVDVIEPNSSVHPTLLNSLRQRGRLISSLENAESGLYDGITAIHVLDHVTHLDVYLKAIFNLLKPDGKICFVTHNEKTFIRRFLSRRWPPFCLQHPQLFSPSSMSFALELQGFKVVRISKTTNYFSLRHVASVLFSLFRIPPWFLKAVPEVIIPMKLGNILTIAEKQSPG